MYYLSLLDRNHSNHTGIYVILSGLRTTNRTEPFLPLIGIAGMTLDIYRILAMGYYAVFIMHILMIFLYYFDDQAGAAAVGFIFFLLTLILTLITRMLGIEFYGLGLVVSAVMSWIIAYIRLKHILKNVNYKMFCDNIRMKT